MDSSKFALAMKSIAGMTTAVTLLLIPCCLRWHLSWLLACTISFGTTSYHFVMRLAVGYGLLKLTNYDFDYHHFWFQPRTWEPALYKKLHVRKWKGKIPTYAPNQFFLEGQSLHRVIQNMCGAELVHEIIMVLSFLPLLTVPVWGAFHIFLITSLLAALFDSIFVMAQRYNRPRLVRVYEKQEGKTCE